MIVKRGSQLKEYINEKVNPSWECRDFVDSAKKYWKSSMDLVLGLSGLRGMGKTTGLLQSLPDIENSLYICAQTVRDEYIDTADDILNEIENNPRKYIIIDEYTWIKDRDELDKSLYTYIQNGYRIAITGTESMTLELLNYGSLAHRVFMVHCNHFSYSEYLRLNHIIDPDKRTMDNYLKNGGVFEEYAIDSFDSMKKYIREGIINSLVSYLGNITEDKATAIVYDIFYKAVYPEPEGESTPSLPGQPMDAFLFYDAVGISPETVYEKADLMRTVDILKKIQVIIEAENLDDTNANRHRYYITNPSLNYQMFRTIYEREEPDALLGSVFEAACVAHFSKHKEPDDILYFLKGNKLMSREYEIDFIIANKNCEPCNSKYAYLFECKHKGGLGLNRGSSIESHEVEEYFPRAYDMGRYVIYRGKEEVYAYLGNRDFIFAPLDSEYLQSYHYFRQQIEELKEKDAIYPRTPDNPFYLEKHPGIAKKPGGEGGDDGDQDGTDSVDMPGEEAENDDIEEDDIDPMLKSGDPRWDGM